MFNATPLKFVIALAAGVVASVGCSATPARTEPQPTGAGAAIMAELSRGECYGYCPVYSISIHEDGTVNYHGIRFVKTVGDSTFRISTAQVAEIRAAFKKARFSDLSGDYTHVDMTDAETVATALTEHGQTKRVAHYHGDTKAPAQLNELEAEIDRLVDIDRLIGTEQEREQIGERTGGRH
jgi:hypothetical protein